MNRRNIILIDNFDSFTFNLVHDLRTLGCHVEVFRNDAPLEFLLQRAADQAAAFVLSPGPAKPSEAGVCPALVEAAAGRHGVLGVCLGHQVIVETFGGHVGRARAILHGKTSSVTLAAHPLFAGLGHRIRVARYHSLAATCLPGELESIAVTDDDGTIMAVAHRELPVFGLQFHPESVMTADGLKILENAIALIAKEPVHAAIA